VLAMVMRSIRATLLAPVAERPISYKTDFTAHCLMSEIFNILYDVSTTAFTSVCRYPQLSVTKHTI